MNEQKKERKAPDLAGLITKEEALEKLFGAWNFTPVSEEIQISESLGRTLAKDYHAKYDQPVVRASSMDGIAVRSADFADGMPDTSAWILGTDYVRADTGDDFDDAFDSVIEIEKVTMLADGGIQLADDVDVTPGKNVSPKGSNIHAGTLVGRAGSQITPLTIAALILGGFDQVEVWKKPIIAFIPTGSELVYPGSELKRGQNFDSNSLMVQAMLTRMGADVILHPIIKDCPGQIAQALDDTLPAADIVILNAGTSKGGEDYCVQYLKQHGNMLFHGVKAVPGRPMSITILDGKPVINMSGPAVGAYYGCLWLIPRILDHMLRHSEPISFAQAEATLTERINVPPFFEALGAIELTTDAEGNLLATPSPRSKGRSAGLLSDAHYINRLGDHPKEAGEKIQVLLNR